MKATIISALLACASFAASAQTVDTWTSADKGKHLVVSGAIGAAATVATDSKAWGTGLCVAVGAAKELADSRSTAHTASWKDLAADAIGCAIGAQIGGLYITPTRDGARVAWSIKF